MQLFLNMLQLVFFICKLPQFMFTLWRAVLLHRKEIKMKKNISKKKSQQEWAWYIFNFTKTMTSLATGKWQNTNIRELPSFFFGLYNPDVISLLWSHSLSLSVSVKEHMKELIEKHTFQVASIKGLSPGLLELLFQQIPENLILICAPYKPSFSCKSTYIVTRKSTAILPHL